jgi:Enoyl-(Acyl carrier protein) reductase
LTDPVRLRQITERIPAARWGDPLDFAGPIIFLASRASQYVCGELLVVDGVRNIFSSVIDDVFQLAYSIGLDGQVGESIETNHEKAQTECNGIMIL